MTYKPFSGYLMPSSDLFLKQPIDFNGMWTVLGYFMHTVKELLSLHIFSYSFCVLFS